MSFDGRRVDSNTEWRADAGILARAAAGEGWIARVGGEVSVAGFEANRSHFTLGHGGYFSPDKFLSVGPSMELLARRDERSFRVDCAVTWQEVREASSEFFPESPELQAASGDPRYPGDSRDGLGVRLAASVEWRIFDRTVAGVRLEGVSGEDADLVRLQIYTRRWSRAISQPVQQPPVPVRAGGYYTLN